VENDFPAVKNLAACVEYQEGSIVSRQIIAQEKGTITIFAFDKGQGLSEHTAPYDAFVYVAEGTACVRIAGKDLRVAQGEMVVMPAHKPHAVKAAERFKMMLVMIRS